MGESERGDLAPREEITYYCSAGHATPTYFSAGVEVPDQWDCPRCGLPAGRDQEEPPPPPVIAPYKTHLAYVKERRNGEDGAALLDEALEGLRSRREEG